MSIETARSLLLQALAELPVSAWTPIRDRLTRPKPTPVALGPAGFQFTDPTFGSKLLRVTDANTASGQACRVSSNAHISAWNADSSRFYVQTAGGSPVLFTFDGTVATQSPIHVGGYVEPAFSYIDPLALMIVAGGNSRTIQQVNVETGTAKTVLDLDVAYPALGLFGYVGGLLTTDGGIWATFFGGASQDAHFLVHHSIAGLFDTRPYGFEIHSISLERTGRYVLIYATQVDINAGKPKVQVWDTVVGTLTPVRRMPGGHDCIGYDTWINQDCCTSSGYDGMQWQIRSIRATDISTDLIVKELTPEEVFIADHPNWRAARSDRAVPNITSTFRTPTPPDVPPAPWRAWDDEILRIATDGSGVVERLCHHQSIYEGEFWDQPIINVDPSGRYALFTSNWDRMVGAGRQDVFLVHLA